MTSILQNIPLGLADIDVFNHVAYIANENFPPYRDDGKNCYKVGISPPIHKPSLFTFFGADLLGWGIFDDDELWSTAVEGATITDVFNPMDDDGVMELWVSADWLYSYAKCLKIEIPAGAPVGIVATHTLASPDDLSTYNKIGFGILTNKNINAKGDFEIVFKNESDELISSIQIPAITANKWSRVEAVIPDFATMSAVKTVNLNMVVEYNADLIIHLDALQFYIGATGAYSGTRKVKYTYYNSTLGIESNPSPASEATEFENEICWGIVYPSQDPQVDKIFLYATSDGGETFQRIARLTYDAGGTGLGEYSDETDYIENDPTVAQIYFKTQILDSQLQELVNEEHNCPPAVTNCKKVGNSFVWFGQTDYSEGLATFIEGRKYVRGDSDTHWTDALKNRAIRLGDVIKSYPIEKVIWFPTVPVFTGTGENDIETYGEYIGENPSVDTYEIEITGDSSPNTFKWRRNDEEWETGVEIVAGAYLLLHIPDETFLKIYVKFDAITGHVIGDSWVFGFRQTLKLYNEFEEGNYTDKYYVIGRDDRTLWYASYDVLGNAVPDYVSPFNYISIPTGIIGVGYYRDRMLVFSENEIYEVSLPLSSSSVVVPTSSKVGCVAAKSVVNDEAGEIYFLSQRGLFKYNGGSPTAVADGNLSIYNSLNREQMRYAVAEFNSKTQRLWLAVSSSGSGKNDLVLIYDKRIDMLASIYTKLNIQSMCICYDGFNNSFLYVGDDIGFIDYESEIYFYDFSGAGTVEGTVTDSDSTSITDEDATFWTTGDGLTGLYLTVFDEAGEYEQIRIESNTATSITLEEAMTLTPVSYKVGLIVSTRKTQKFFNTNRIAPRSLTVIREPQTSGELKINHYGQEYFETAMDLKSSIVLDNKIPNDLFKKSFQFGGRTRIHQFELVHTDMANFKVREITVDFL